VAATTLHALRIIETAPELRNRLNDNARRLRTGLTRAGFTLEPGQHPIIPVMLGDAVLAARMADALLEHGVYVVGFSYPVVPQGRARIRAQVSAAHKPEQIERAIEAFATVGSELGVVH
jgi:glycine C-acetyltransferase